LALVWRGSILRRCGHHEIDRGTVHRRQKRRSWNSKKHNNRKDEEGRRR
jgi:hypothetical protein